METTRSEPLHAGSLSGIEFGFTMPMAAGAGERVTVLMRAAGLEMRFDPDLDERIANEPCPSCGRRFADLPIGHAWSLDLATRSYSCGNPIIPGEVLARKDETR